LTNFFMIDDNKIKIDEGKRRIKKDNFLKLLLVAINGDYQLL